MNSIKLHNSFGRWSNDIPNNDLDTVINYVLTNHTIQSVPDDSKKLIIYSRQFNDEIDKNSKVNKDTFAIIENILGKPEQFILDNSKHIHGLFIYNFHTSI